MPTTPPPRTPLPSTPLAQPPSGSMAGLSNRVVRQGEHERNHGQAFDFADHSWDLATGGLKTLTAKRELPPGLERRSSERLGEPVTPPRSYTFTLVILACIVVMVISGAIILIMLMQP